MVFVIGFIVICVLCYATTKNKDPVSNLINSSSEATRFSPTYFEIYDKSTKTNCTRLIVIYPFRWYILSKNNKVYVLDSESGYDCPTQMTPGVVITKSNNLEVVCLSMNKDAALKYFDSVAPIRIEYNLIGVEKFTITDALNMLFENYLTLEEETIKKILPGPLKYVSVKIPTLVNKFKVDASKIVPRENLLKTLSKYYANLYEIKYDREEILLSIGYER